MREEDLDWFSTFPRAILRDLWGVKSIRNTSVFPLHWSNDETGISLRFLPPVLCARYVIALVHLSQARERVCLSQAVHYSQLENMMKTGLCLYLQEILNLNSISYHAGGRSSFFRYLRLVNRIIIMEETIEIMDISRLLVIKHSPVDIICFRLFVWVRLVKRERVSLINFKDFAVFRGKPAAICLNSYTSCLFWLIFSWTGKTNFVTEGGEDTKSESSRKKDNNNNNSDVSPI